MGAGPKVQPPSPHTSAFVTQIINMVQVVSPGASLDRNRTWVDLRSFSFLLPPASTSIPLISLKSQADVIIKARRRLKKKSCFFSLVLRTHEDLFRQPIPERDAPTTTTGFTAHSSKPVPSASMPLHTHAPALTAHSSSDQLLWPRSNFRVHHQGTLCPSSSTLQQHPSVPATWGLGQAWTRRSPAPGTEAVPTGTQALCSLS